MHLNFYVLVLLCAETFSFFEKHGFVFCFSKTYLFPQINAFSEKTFFKQKSFTLMLIFSKLFIWHLSRTIIRIESAGKEAAIEKSRAVIGGERINEKASFVYNL